jgi:hypothetical protein
MYNVSDSHAEELWTKSKYVKELERQNVKMPFQAAKQEDCERTVHTVLIVISRLLKICQRTKYKGKS